MLNPDARSLYTDALSPPAGLVFEKGLATTYSLDITTLLTVPIQLTLAGIGKKEELLQDGVTLLDSLRRTVENICVLCERGRIKVPGEKHMLYGMLEPVIVEAAAPSGGAFHPKVWLLKFGDPSGEIEAVYRLLVLSRNLTDDRSWDVALSMDGKKTGSSLAVNKPLREFLGSLSGMAVGEMGGNASGILRDLADEIDDVEWELPEGFFEVSFHWMGEAGSKWMPSKSSSIVVMSPFLSERALKELTRTSTESLALVSRPEELSRISRDVLDLFDQRMVLHEAAATEEGEEDEGCELGLHAKLYIFREFYNTHVVLGSANATSSALLNGSNVEFLVELVGKHKDIGLPEDFLSSDKGMGELLVDFVPAEEEAIEEKEDEAEKALENLWDLLIGSHLRLRCSKQEGQYRLSLLCDSRINLPREVELRVWPITIPSTSAVRIMSITPDEAVVLMGMDVVSITGFLAFELKTKGLKRRFVLNLPVENLPAGRSSAILKAVISNREGFVRYLLMLLGGLNSTGLPAGSASGSGSWFRSIMGGDEALLEDLVLALSRDPERLRTISRIIDDLKEAEHSSDIFPEGFIEFWSVFEDVLAEES